MPGLTLQAQHQLLNGVPHGPDTQWSGGSSGSFAVTARKPRSLLAAQECSSPPIRIPLLIKMLDQCARSDARPMTSALTIRLRVHWARCTAENRSLGTAGDSARVSACLDSSRATSGPSLTAPAQAPRRRSQTDHKANAYIARASPAHFRRQRLRRSRVDTTDERGKRARFRTRFGRCASHQERVSGQVRSPWSLDPWRNTRGLFHPPAARWRPGRFRGRGRHRASSRNRRPYIRTVRIRDPSTKRAKALWTLR